MGWLVCRLSPRSARGLARLIAWLLFSVLRLRRRVCLENLRRAFPEHDDATLLQRARAVYGHLARVIVDVLRLPRLDAATARAWLGAAVARLHLLRRPRGLLVLVGHLGSWDLLACAAANAGLPLHVVTRRLKSKGVDRQWQALRAAWGVRLHAAQGSALALLRALQRGEIVALPLDQHEPAGQPTTFFGRPAATSTALARLARASGAPVIAAFLLRRGETHELVVEGPFAPVEDVAVATQAYTAQLEAAIRRAPEQWLWLHRRWKLEGEEL